MRRGPRRARRWSLIKRKSLKILLAGQAQDTLQWGANAFWFRLVFVFQYVLLYIAYGSGILIRCHFKGSGRRSIFLWGERTRLLVLGLLIVVDINSDIGVPLDTSTPIDKHPHPWLHCMRSFKNSTILKSIRMKVTRILAASARSPDLSASSSSLWCQFRARLNWLFEHPGFKSTCNTEELYLDS